MTTNEISDGQVRYSGPNPVLNCFFCYQDSRGCILFRFDSADPKLVPFAKKGFVACPKCAAKGNNYLAGEIAAYVVLLGKKGK